MFLLNNFTNEKPALLVTLSNCLSLF